MDYQSIVTFVMEMAGSVAFAASGAMVGVERNMDIFGVSVLGVATAVGGGMIRDIVLGIIPPAVFTNPVYALVSVLASCIVFFIFYFKRELLQGHRRETYDKIMLAMDSVGLGIHAFKMAYDFLTENEDTADTYRYMMVGYKLENTLTENGHVARGVCVTDEEGHLLKINERTHIEKHDGGTAYTEDDGKTWTMLPEGSTVSMNMWGFSASILKELKDRFPKFLDENLKVNPLKCEYFLPFVVDELLGEKRATVKVLKSMDKWYGVTYKEDKPVVVAAIQNLKDGGLYPQRLWEE